MQNTKGNPHFQTFLIRNAKENFYNLLLCKQFYLTFDMAVVQICICIIYKIVLYFISTLHDILKKSLFCSLVKMKIRKNLVSICY